METKQPVFYTHFNPRPRKIAEISSESMTIPDQSLSTRELIERYARGLPIPNEKKPLYLEGTGLLDVTKLSKLDITILAKENAKILKEKNARFLEIKKAKDKEKFEQLVRAAAENLSSQAVDKSAEKPKE